MSKIDDLQQIFRILPVLVERQSMPISELMTLGGYAKKAELLKDLEAMTMLGTPPYTPADLFDVEIRSDTASLHSGSNLSRPLSLNPQEWLLLRTLIEKDRSMDRSGALPEQAMVRLMEDLGTVPVHFIEAGPEAEFRSSIEQALTSNRSIQLRYSNADGPEQEERQIDPWVLFEHNRSRYLLGYDHSRGDSRVFRLDRIITIRVLKVERKTSAPENIDSLQSARETSSKCLIRFRFPEHLLPALQREFKFQIESQADRSVNASIETSNLEFFRWYLRAYATFIEVIEPVELRQWIIDEVRRFPIPEPIS